MASKRSVKHATLPECKAVGEKMKKLRPYIAQIERQSNRWKEKYRALAGQKLPQRLMAAERLIGQLQKELARWQANCTGQHGSQVACGIPAGAGAAGAAYVIHGSQSDAASEPSA